MTPDAIAWKEAKEEIKWRRENGYKPSDIYLGITGIAPIHCDWDNATALVATAIMGMQDARIHEG